MYKPNKVQFTHKLAIFIVIWALVLGGSKPQVAHAGWFGLDGLFGNSNAVTPANVFPLQEERKPSRVMTVVATAYSSTEDQTDDTPFITSNGLHVYDGLIAANWLPYGTRVRFPDLYGDKVFTVNDRMNERYGYGRVDLWMDKPVDEVMEFGVKQIKMEIF